MPGERDWIGIYLEEDLGAGDITSTAVLPEGHRGRACIVARERLFLAGTPHAVEVFRRLGAAATPSGGDGRWVASGEKILEVAGPSRAILAGERLALNLLGRMSGIATLTRELVERLSAASCPAAVAGTRKTTPGFRAFEKEAIRIAGGDPHRSGLFDEAMVKDNHILACGGDVAAAVRSVVAAHPAATVACEAESLEDALAAAGAGAHWVLIDNQPPAAGKQWAREVRKRFPRIKIEASGGIRPDTLLGYGWADRVSLGWLTQKAPGKDLSLEWDA